MSKGRVFEPLGAFLHLKLKQFKLFSKKYFLLEILNLGLLAHWAGGGTLPYPYHEKLPNVFIFTRVKQSTPITYNSHYPIPKAICPTCV